MSFLVSCLPGFEVDILFLPVCRNNWVQENIVPNVLGHSPLVKLGIPYHCMKPCHPVESSCFSLARRSAPNISFRPRISLMNWTLFPFSNYYTISVFIYPRPLIIFLLSALYLSLSIIHFQHLSLSLSIPFTTVIYPPRSSSISFHSSSIPPNIKRQIIIPNSPST